MTRSAEYPVKFFMNGRSQAVRLPKELRLEAAEGIAYRDGEAIVIRPAGTWPKGYFGSWKALDPAFMAPDRPEGETLNERMDTLFGKRK